MKRMPWILLVVGALACATGCDELEEINVDLGFLGTPFGYGGSSYTRPSYYVYDPGPSYYEEVWIEEEYYVEETWYEDDWVYWP